jgi:hypothetical protein
VGLSIHWPSTAFTATDAEPKTPWPLPAVGILLAAAVGFKWVKLRGAGKNLAVTHQAIDKYDVGKQDLLDHELGLHAAIDAKPFPIWWRQQDLILIGCNSAYYETLLGESLEIGVDAIDDEGRSRSPTLSFV